MRSRLGGLLRTFIQLFALFSTAESALFLARGSFALSPSDIGALSGTYVGGNPVMMASLAQQTADYRVGIVLLVVALSLQMANTLWPMRPADFQVSRNGALLAFGVAVVLLVAAWWFADWHAKSLERQVLGPDVPLMRDRPTR
jgi:hypothetical protein